MNQTIVNKTKELLKELLDSCTTSQQDFFKRMYSKDLSLDIKTVVDNMDESKIDHALTQVERTVEKNLSQW